MAEQIVMPKLAMAMKQGTIVEWQAGEGDRVEKGQVIMVIETEKVTYEVEAPVDGFLHILVPAGETVNVQTPVGILAESEEELKSLGGDEAPAQSSEDATAAAPAESPAAVAAPAAVSTGGGRVKISPLAKKIAAQNNLDITRIQGTGPGGRIKKRDVEKAMQTGVASASAAAPFDGEVIDGKRVKATVPIAGMRKSISDHMMHSLSVSAQMTGMTEADMTRMIEIRNNFLKKQEQLGTRISHTDLMIYTISRTMKRHPAMNASVVGSDLKIWEDVNVAVAVAIDKGEYESGLITPVIKQADKKSLVEISLEVKDLAKRARSGELSPEDMSASTITLTNVGPFARGWTQWTPILNQPHSIIVGTGGITDRAMVKDGQIVALPIMNMCVTFDHRVLDGAVVAKYLATLTEAIENPEMLFI